MARIEHAPLQAHELDDLLAQAARETAAEAEPPGADFMARILRDADAVLAEQARLQPGKSAPRVGFWAGLIAGIGGWPSLAGLVSATVAGIWIGYAGPDTLSEGVAAALWSTDTSESFSLEDLTPGFGDLSALFEES